MGEAVSHGSRPNRGIIPDGACSHVEGQSRSTTLRQHLPDHSITDTGARVGGGQRQSSGKRQSRLNRAEQAEPAEIPKLSLLRLLGPPRFCLTLPATPNMHDALPGCGDAGWVALLRSPAPSARCRSAQAGLRAAPGPAVPRAGPQGPFALPEGTSRGQSCTVAHFDFTAQFTEARKPTAWGLPWALGRCMKG